MGKENKNITTKQLITAIVEGIESKKGEEIVNLDLTGVDGAECDNYIVCHGSSNRNVVAVADSVVDILRDLYGLKAWHSDGFKNGEWILLDYGTVMVHIFQQEFRERFRLEKLWADAKVVTL